jgi:hypothetical protein
MLGVSPDAATETAVVLRDLSATLADGERIEPGDQISAPDGRMLSAARFETAMSPVVAVDGPALVLGDAAPAV